MRFQSSIIGLGKSPRFPNRELLFITSEIYFPLIRLSSIFHFYGVLVFFKEKVLLLLNFITCSNILLHKMNNFSQIGVPNQIINKKVTFFTKFEA